MRPKTLPQRQIYVAIAIIANLTFGSPELDPDTIRTETAIDELVVPNAGPLQDPSSLPEAPAEPAGTEE